MIQTCCQLVLQSSTEQWGQHYDPNSVALHWCWVTAELCEQPIPIDELAMTRTCCKSVLQSSTEQWGLYYDLNRVALHWCWPFFHS